jgi:hypothetical protein
MKSLRPKRLFTSRKFFSLLVLALCLPNQVSQAYGNSDIAEALTYSGCTFGLGLDPKEFGMDQSVASAIHLGLAYKIIDEGESTDVIEKMDTPKGRRGYENLRQSWATAGLLNSKWKSLETTYEKGLAAGLKKWKSGATLGVARNSAQSMAVSKLTALCRVAEISVTAKAKKSKIPLRQYIIKVSGEYLAPLP